MPVEPVVERSAIRPKWDSTYEELKPEPTDEEQVRMTYAEPRIFASALEEPRRRSGLSIWFAAAASLVLGIVIGFASGYRAGQGSSGVPVAVDGPAPTSGATSPGQPFSESSVPDPVRLEEEKIVPAPSSEVSAPKAPASSPRQQAAPTPAPITPQPAPVAPRQATPPAPAPAPTVEKTPRLITGPGSLEIVSRPAGAEVVVDGKPVGRTPLSVEVSPGEHTVRLALPGFNGWQTTVDVKPGSPTRVAASLEQ